MLPFLLYLVYGKVFKFAVTCISLFLRNRVARTQIKA